MQAYIIQEGFEVIGALFSGMNERDINTLTQMSPTDKSCYIYRSRTVPQVLVCLCNAEVEPEQSYSWVNQVLLNPHPANVFLSRKMKSAFMLASYIFKLTSD